jgi:hypothetical protein
MAAIGESSQPARALLFACNATPNTCSVLPACNGATCAIPQAPRADLALSEVTDETVPEKEGGGHPPTRPLMPEPSALPETENLPNADRAQAADGSNAPNRCNAFPERPAAPPSRSELCAYLSSAIRHSDTCLDSPRDEDARRAAKQARERRLLHTRLWNLKTEHAQHCGAS